MVRPCRYHRPAVSRSKLRKDRRGAVTILTIDRPEARNAIDAETASLLAEEIGSFGRDGEARVLVVTGTGPEAFCAGATSTT
jgi:enoyl-CoA hydratase/carnithine racemase